MNLRAKVTIGASIVTLLVATTLVATSWLSQQHVQNMFSDATITGKTVLWKKIITGQHEKMIAGTSSIARDRATRKAVKNRDIEALNESAATTFNLLSASNVLTHMQIINTGSEVLYSAPDKYTGISGKSLVQKAIAEGKIASGIERAGNGRLLAIVAFPMTMRGKPIGVGVFARDMDDALLDFKANDHSEVMIANSEGHAEYETTENMLQALDLSLPALGETSLHRVSYQDSSLSVASMPIINSTGDAVAHLVTAHDYTEQYAAQTNTNILAYSIAILVIVGGVIALFFYMKLMLKPLADVVNNLNSLAEGDLTFESNTSSNDEIGQLQAAMQTTATQLRDVIQLINNISGQLDASSADMFTVTQEMGQNVQGQQSGIEQVATAINEMTSTVQEVARNATNAASSANSANEESLAGREVVSSTVNAINQLATEVENASSVIDKVRHDSEVIGTILDVIRGVAEQTNLLALNAAIEAARAGEQGRGFAVVADEVRTLASRTQESTEEIHSMIEQLQGGIGEAVKVMQVSRERTEDTVAKANKAGDSLNAITEAVSIINDMNTQIASAAEEQSCVTEEINRNITEISHAAENSAQASQKTFRSSENLNMLVEDLNNVVNRFKL